MPQFTTVAAFFAMGAISCLLELRRSIYYDGVIKKKYTILLFVFVFLSYATRKKIFLMVMPIILVIIFVILIEKYQYKKYVFGITLGISVICIFLSLLTTITYNSKKNYDYTQFNISRSKVMDYKGLPDYYDNEKFYQKIGMSEAVYAALSERNFDVNDSISTENLNKIKDYSNLIDTDSLFNKLFKSTNQVFKNFFSSETIFTSLAILFIFFSETKRFLENKNCLETLLGCIFPLYIIGGILFLILCGRMMDRLIEAMGLFLAGGFFGGIFIKDKINCRNKHKSNGEIISNFIRYCSLIIIMSICMLGNQYQLQRNDTGIRSVVFKKSEELETLKLYALEHPQNFYFYNSLDFIASSELVFEKDSHTFLNMDSLGNWYSKSPLYYKRNKKIGFTSAIDGLINNKNVFYAEIGTYHSCLDQLLEDKGKYFECVDSISINDTEINIYEVKELTTE